MKETTIPIKPAKLRRIEAAFLVYADRATERTESICGVIEPDENYLVLSSVLQALPPGLAKRFKLATVAAGTHIAKEGKKSISFLELGAQPRLYRFREGGPLAVWIGCTAGFFAASGEKRIYAVHDYLAFERNGRINLIPTAVVDF